MGARYRTPLRGLTIAGTATNMGPAMKFEEDEFLLPFNVRFGAAWRTRALLEGLILAADLRFPNDSDTKGNIGAELQLHPMIALRGGMKLNYDEEMGTAGVGIRYRDYEFDYAYSPFSEESQLGDGLGLGGGFDGSFDRLARRALGRVLVVAQGFLVVLGFNRRA